MRRAVSIGSVLFAAILGAGPLIAQTAPATSSPQADLERRFDAVIDPAELGSWIKIMAAEPNHVGSAHNKANAERVLAQFKSWGWDAHIETFEVLYPTPVSQTLELIAPTRFKATLTEAPIPGDETSSRTRNVLPAYVAYQGDGDVTAPLVYVNYGMQDDYKTLERMGVSVKGKIVIARYGAGWRGLKPKLAQEHGAVGCIIYSDPRDDGYSIDDAYPKGAARPSNGVQRGSVADMTLFPGDPLTPGIGATTGAARLSRADAPSILKIPVLPISHGDAERLLAGLGGRVAPPGWRGSLPITYHVGGDVARAHLAVRSEWSLKTIYNVVATIKGSQYPDQWVLRGNHHDAWVNGANDPMSGNVAMLGEAKAIGVLVSQGWRPKRTLVYLSWDAEEPMLLGSTEWAETHAAELKEKGLIYINTDGNSRGFLYAAGSHSLQHFVNSVAADVTDPQTGVSVAARVRAALQVAGSVPARTPKRKSAPRTRSIQHVIYPSTRSDQARTFRRFCSIWGWRPSISVLAARARPAASIIPPMIRTSTTAASGIPALLMWPRRPRPSGAWSCAWRMPICRPNITAVLPIRCPQYVDEVKKLADTKRDAAETQAKLLASGAYRLTDDPTKTSGLPTPLKSVPRFNFAPLENALDHLKKSAKDYDAVLTLPKDRVSPMQSKSQLFALARQAEQSLAPAEGLPGRTWYKHLIYAPGRFTGYEPKTLPGVREAIEEERWEDVDRYAELHRRSFGRLRAEAG